MSFITLVGILPQLIGLVSRIFTLLQNKKVEDAQTYVMRINTAIDQVAAAESQADHENAAKGLANALAGK